MGAVRVTGSPVIPKIWWAARVICRRISRLFVVFDMVRIWSETKRLHEADVVNKRTCEKIPFGHCRSLNYG